MIKTYSLLLLAALAFTNTVNATVITDLYGDKDCFGTNAICTEGVTVPGGYSAVTSEPSDPTWTDTWTSGGSPTWSHSIAAGSYSTASISISTAGIADIAGPYSVFVDSVLVGSMPKDDFGHVLVELFTFAFDAALLADGLAQVSFSSIDTGDGWAIDYAELIATTSDSPVPAPTPLALLVLGMVSLRLTRHNK